MTWFLAGNDSAHDARKAIATLAALICLLVAAPGAAGAAVVEQSREEVLDYWTAERMQDARPGELLAAGSGEISRSDPSGAAGPALRVPAAAAGGAEGAPLRRGLLERRARQAADGSRFVVGDPRAPGTRAHGKVFLTIPGLGDFVCSGTVVNSFTRSLVSTAGHCVSEGRRFASNWMFVPAYADGNAPYGRWSASSLDATDGWKSSSDLRFDVGMATVAPNDEGETIQEVVGARGIAFNQPRRQFYTSYGYPAEQPPFEFTGEREFACASSWRGDDSSFSPPRPMQIACDMTAGSSGGGWVAAGSVLSLNSFKAGLLIIADNRYMYGPYFGDGVRELYERVRGTPIFCAGEEATIFGSDGADRLNGTKGSDVIAALGGGDRIKGRGGNDLICAGAGNDRIRGGGGHDDLRGQRGHDRLRGGRGRDICRGGKGRDRGSSCERKRSTA